MRITALLTFTGAGTVIHEWLNGFTLGSAASPQFGLLALAVAGLGLLTLYSEQLREDREADNRRPAPQRGTSLQTEI